MSEDYVGIKFKVDFLSKKPPEMNSNLKKLIHYCQLFDKFNLAPPYQGGSAGNLSFRKAIGEKEFIITGTKIGLKSELTPEKFVLVKDVDIDQKIVKVIGMVEPSSESILHWSIYNARPEINSVFHGHSEMLLSVSQKLQWAETQRIVPYGSLDLVDEVISVLHKNNFIIIKEHGFLSMGKNIREAGDIAFKKLQEASQLISL